MLRSLDQVTIATSNSIGNRPSIANVDGPMSVQPFDLGGANGGLPTALALPPTQGDPVRFGEEAFVSGADLALMTNWKLLLGKTDFEVMTERKNSDPLNRALERATLEDVTRLYFEFVLSRVMESGRFKAVPEFVIGIPSAAAKTAASRTRYRRSIEKALIKLGAPKPRFFLEPFAVFQHHLFSGYISDTGKPQNVLVVDIGGGTTNVCVIQTSHHGRLARGGANHKPHGVETFDIGGSDIDRMILNRVVRSTRIRDMKATVLARLAKEKISEVLNRQKTWDIPDKAASVRETISLEGQGDWSVSGLDLAQIVERSFWPSVKATILESLTSARASKIDGGLERIDVVIFAGGTCQIQLLHSLFRRDFGSMPELMDHKFVVSPQYDRAVASGLALEACANSRLHDLRPTRVAPYLQSDVHFGVGHSLQSIDVPMRLKLREGPPDCRPSGDVILKAPFSITDLTGQQVEWQFQLKQQPDRVCLKFFQDDGGVQLPLGPTTTVKVARKGEVAGYKCKLRLVFHEDGIADVGLSVWSNAEHADVAYQATRLDLHELREMESEVFVGLDFGTTNTFVAEVIARPDHHEAMPSRYEVDAVTMDRARSLDAEARAYLKSVSDAKSLLSNHEESLLKDYVYHSNRIEGSVLTRGQTQRILADVPDDKSLHARNIQREVEEVAFVDDSGEIRTISRPVKDQVAAVNLRDAFLYVKELATGGREMSPFLLKDIHNLIVRGESSARPGLFRNDNVKISHATFVPPDSTQVEQLISEMCAFFRESEFESWPPIYQATYAHARFVSIHPFHDGNGRLARLVANYFLWRAEQPSVMLPWENRDRYYDALEECNTFENRNRGSLADLAALFCDLFEDAISNIKLAQLQTSAPIDEPVISAGSTKSKRLNSLLERIGSGRRAVDIEAQYGAWQAAFSALSAEVKESALLVDGAFRERWGGGIDVREYPIIDLETFRAIREGKPYSRTWFMSLRLALPRSTEDIVFYFGRASPQVCRLDSRLERTAALGISRMNRTLMKHVNVYQETWSRVKEITHDGATMGLSVSGSDSGLRYFTAENSDFSDWFAVLMEDATETLGGFQLDGASFGQS